MNTEYLNMLQNTIITELAKDMNKRLGDENTKEIRPSADDVFANLPLLYDTVEEKSFGTEATGRSYRYMPKRYKAMVMRLIAPEYYPDVKITYKTDAENQAIGVCAEARIFLNANDQKPVAYGKQYLSYSSISEPFEDVSDLHAYAESTVRGIALSKAYQEFGIGSWYSYRFEPEENPDATLTQLENSDKVNPIKAYDDSEIQEFSIKPEETPAATENQPNSEIPQTDEPVPETDPSVKGETTPADQQDYDTPVKEETAPVDQQDKKTSAKSGKTGTKGTGKNAKSKKPGISLEDAKALPAPIGKAATMNLTLGQTEEKYPGNIPWMYTHVDEVASEERDKIRDALIVITLNNPSIQNMFKDRNIELPS